MFLQCLSDTEMASLVLNVPFELVCDTCGGGIDLSWKTSHGAVLIHDIFIK